MAKFSSGFEIIIHINQIKNYFMKNIIILTLLLVLGVGNFASASENIALNPMVSEQNSGQPVRFTDKKYFKSFIRNIAALETLAFKGNYIPDIKDVNVRALKDFQNRFNDVAGVKWFSDNNGYTTYFNKDGFNDRAFYNKKGLWQYSLIFYTEDKLPKDVRSIVKSKYYDLVIYMAEEVHTVDGKGYIVYLEDNSQIRIVKVSSENEMETMTELVKN